MREETQAITPSIVRGIFAAILLLLSFGAATAQVRVGYPTTFLNRVFYAGNTGKERFSTTVQLSDNTVLIGGSADNLDWIALSVPRVVLPSAGIANGQGTNRVGFLLHVSADLSRILRVVHFPQGAVENVRWIKTTNLPDAPTRAMLISGTTLDTRNNGGYFLARLNGNFVQTIPTGLEWVRNIWATGDHQTFQPWDVGNDGKIIYATGQPYGADWCAVYRLRADGTDDSVEDWRHHEGVLTATGANTSGEWTPASSRAEVTVRKSGVIFKTSGRIQLRSWTSDDYNAILPDGNGGTKQGRWPLDLFFSGPGNPANPGGSPGGPGYTGYRTGANPTHRIGSIAVDRRTNHFVIGFSVQSRLPDGNPDFEPAVLAMTATGALKWWSRLYTETSQNSSPDQYVDGLAIDYSAAGTGAIVVLARCHGNNVFNLWGGNSISQIQNPLHPGRSFHDQFTGSNGNIHISWLGKLRESDGTLLNATYVAEYVDNMQGTGAAYTNPLLDGWADHNAGWPGLNTTRCQTDVRVDQAGRVYLLGVGRRTITTARAYQRMIKPSEGSSTWNAFVRVYEPNLLTLVYSSLLVGTWNPATGAGSDNTELSGICPTQNGVLVVGYHKIDMVTGAAKGNPVPTVRVPGWGFAAPNGESALAGLLYFPPIQIDSVTRD